MATSEYIPAGRTSRIVRGSSELQIQTEYNYRPNPRLTTTIFSGGQVLRKVEQELPQAIGSAQDMMRVEGLLRKQHMEVMTLMDAKGPVAPPPPPPKPEPESVTNKSALQQLKEIAGVERIFRVGNDGQFEAASLSDDFKKRHGAVFKNLCEVLDIFGSLPGGRREDGVCELQRNRLYLISTGYEYFFVLARHVEAGRDLEAEIRAAVNL